ncbi:uncharacterized protein LOC109840211 [Asparagus officinalis]|uniref:uncharacterized protein LOC109840211 n=1 Tax=Asparagus officinalis TaxID=4686 RepID=UPI00098E1906|nr:uncharacterized protein LOC109840211 [Asparagus officinalis]
MGVEIEIMDSHLEWNAPKPRHLSPLKGALQRGLVSGAVSPILIFMLCDDLPDCIQVASFLSYELMQSTNEADFFTEYGEASRYQIQEVSAREVMGSSTRPWIPTMERRFSHILALLCLATGKFVCEKFFVALVTSISVKMGFFYGDRCPIYRLHRFIYALTLPGIGFTVKIRNIAIKWLFQDCLTVGNFCDQLLAKYAKYVGLKRDFRLVVRGDARKLPAILNGSDDEVLIIKSVTHRDFNAMIKGFFYGERCQI